MMEQLLEDKLQDIHRILSETQITGKEIGVLDGSLGLAIFHFYYNHCYQNQQSENLGIQIITNAVAHINEGYSLFTFCSGMSGAAWAIELLNEEGLIDIDCDELLFHLDDYLKKVVDLDTEKQSFDFLYGLLGVAFYLLKRYENTKSNSLKVHYQDLLEEVVKKLEETAIADEKGIYWTSYLVKEENLKGINLSLSHGLSSIINFLSRLGRHSHFKSRIKTLVEGTVSYMLNVADEVDGISSFPDWITTDGFLSKSNRLAWCYGDLGIGLSLLRVSRFLESEELYKKALAILKKQALRRDIVETRIGDAGICHGAFGVSHIFGFLHKETGEQVFQETEKYWLEVGLSMGVHKEGLAGYSAKRTGKIPEWENDYSFLEGITGIGLVILSYLHPDCHAWNQSLLLGD